jgi:heptosyltransferase-3
VELSVRRPLAELAAALVPGALGPPVDGAAAGALFTVAAPPDPALAAWLRDADLVHAWLGRGGVAATVAARARALGAAAVRCHAVERGDGPIHASAAYAAALGVPGPLRMPALALGPRPEPVRWDRSPPHRLVVHPGAGSHAKRWSATGFRLIADGWRGRGGETTVLLGPAEEDQAAFWEAAGHRVCAGLELRDAAALLASAPRFVGNDSGVSHLAGALGRAGAVLFGPTRPARWRPLGGDLAALRFARAAEGAVAAAVLRRLGAPRD